MCSALPWNKTLKKCVFHFELRTLKCSFWIKNIFNSNILLLLSSDRLFLNNEFYQFCFFFIQPQALIITVINSSKIVIKRNRILAQDYFISSRAFWMCKFCNGANYVQVTIVFIFSPVQKHFAILQPYSCEHL